MKFRLFAMIVFAMILPLSLVAWAQENPSTATPNATPKPESQSCCHHAADAKGAMGCCHHAADTKDASSAKNASGCCGKNKAQCQAKESSCCRMGSDTKDAKSCCADKDMKACIEECKKNGGCADGKCCGDSGGKSAMNCCGNHCQRHEHAASAS